MVRKVPRFLRGAGASPEKSFHQRGFLPRHVPFEEHLQGKFPGFVTVVAHRRRWGPRAARSGVFRAADFAFSAAAGEYFRESCAISIAPIAAAYPLFESFSPARARACSFVSHVSTQNPTGTPVSSWASWMPRAVSEQT